MTPPDSIAVDLARTLIDSLPVLISYIDTEERYQWVNLRYESFFQLSRDQIIGKLIREMFSPEAYNQISPFVRRVLQGESIRYELFVPDHQQNRVLDVQYVPHRDDRGAIVGFFVLAIDITDRKQMEEELFQQKETLQTIFDNIPLMITLFDADGNLQLLNRTTEITFGWSQEDLQKVNILEQAYPDPKERDRILALMKEATGRWEDMTARTRDGRVLKTTWANIRLSNDRRIGIGQDITERQRVERELYQSENRYRALLQAMPDLLFLFDGDGIYLDYHAGDPNELLHSPEYFLGRRLEEILPTDLASRFMGAIESAKRTKSPQVLEYELTIRENVIPYESRLIPLDDNRFLMIARNITERKRIEREKAQFELQLQEGQRMESLGVLAGGIAHDFNNLLTGIMGFADLAAAELPPDSSIQDYLRQIQKSSRRAAELCAQMLAFAGKGLYIRGEVDLNQILRESISMVQLSIHRRISIVSQLEERPILIEADIQQMRQLTINLLLNASEAIGNNEGSIEIHSSRMMTSREYLNGFRFGSDRPEGDYLLLRIRDTGCGILEQNLSRIFEPFYTTKFTGRGLGLSAVLGIVRTTLGAIRVQSQVGSGSVFEILFPISKTEKLLPPNPESSSKPEPGIILVADDESTIRLLLSHILKPKRFEVFLAENGRQLLDLLPIHASHTRLIFLDLTMPVLSGEETLHQLRQNYPDMPVVLMSGYSVGEISQRFQDPHIIGFLQKPFGPTEVMEMVQKVVSS
jgi:two-component system cell cycle sensor histidine kinase/response regulator CckA